MTLELSPQIEARLYETAEMEGIDLPTLVEKMLQEYELAHSSMTGANQEEGPTLLDRFGHLFGTVKGGANENRSEHPENYMQGFGETRESRN